MYIKFLGRRSISGSCIGSIEETQEMLDFCGEKNITCMIEKVSMDNVNVAMERLAKSDVHYRFVLDIAETLKVQELTFKAQRINLKL